MLAVFGAPVVALGISSPSVQAQATQATTCRASAPAAPVAPNIFTPEQERDLGEIIAEQFESEFRVIEDPALVAPLREMGARLARHLPSMGLRPSFFLVDFPDINAFALPGGRVYVSRRLVRFAQSEDELAGVLGHELGHLVARQQSVAMTARLKQILGVTEVGDRHDIELKFNRLIDNAARRPNAFNSESHDRAEQLEADRIGLFIAAAAGYDPSAHSVIFQRMSGADTNRGFVSRLFGTVSPDAKRLGELVRGAAALPPGCATPRATGGREAYDNWRGALARFSETARPERLPADVRRTQLSPFRGEVGRLRFSPDGAFILAQDDAGVTVFAGDPVEKLFQVEAPAAEPAQFSADSSFLFVRATGARIEKWNLKTRALDDVWEHYFARPCAATALSPNGRFFACVDFGDDLHVIDVESGQSVLNQDDFFRDTPGHLLFFLARRIDLNTRSVGELLMEFSPDSRFFVAAHQNFQRPGRIVFDLTTRKPAPIPVEAARLLDSGFTFLSKDRILAINAREPLRSVILTLPSGAVESLDVPNGYQEAATDGRHVLIRPLQDQNLSLGVFDLTTRKIVKTSVTTAFDVFGDRYVAERGVTDIGVHDLDNDRILGQGTLPATALGQPRVVAVSADLKWIAVSERTRGIMWNAETGANVRYVRDFDGAFIDESGILFADLSKSGNQPRAVMRLDSANGAVSNAGDIGDASAQQQGRWLLIAKPLAQGVELAMRDVRRPESLWARRFTTNPPEEVWLSPTGDAVVVAWSADTVAGQAIIRQDPALRARVKPADAKGDYVMDVVDAATGTDRGRVYLESGKGSFAVRRVTVTGDRLFLTDTLGRVLQYSISSGELRGYAFGEYPVMHEASGLLAVSAGAGRVVLYDLNTMRRKREMTFSRDVVLTAFSLDGKSLFALTADQRAYVVPIS